MIRAGRPDSDTRTNVNEEPNESDETDPIGLGLNELDLLSFNRFRSRSL